MNDIDLKPGLAPTPADERDFQLGALIDLPALSELPASFRFPTLGVKDQKDTDFCTAFASDLLHEIMTGVELCPEWGFAASKSLSGDTTGYGQDIRTALKRHVKLGALPKNLTPYSLETKDAGFLRDFANWPAGLTGPAAHQLEKSFLKITGPYDHYDNIRASIWQFRNEKRAVIFGMNWKWVLSQYLLNDGDKNGFGHAIAAIGWEEGGIVLQNSAGLRAGQSGCHLIDRASINFFVEVYNAYMLVGFSPDHVEYMLSNNIKIGDNWFIALLKALRLWPK
jgi:hypothetical protein